MPFEKGNQLGKKNLGTTYAKTEAWNNYGMSFVTGFTGKYQELMSRLANKEKISKEEQEFMDRYERQLEYFKPKLARREHVGGDGGPLQIKLIKYGDTIPVQPKELPGTIPEGNG